jgi:hypothetical protein
MALYHIIENKFIENRSIECPVHFIESHLIQSPHEREYFD